MNTKRRMLIMVPVLLLAAWLAFFADKTPNDSVAEPVARPSTSSIDAPTDVATAPASVEPDTQAGGVVRLTTRAVLKTELASPDDVDIFAVASAAASSSAPVEAPPPPPVVVPFAFLGKKYEDGKWTAFFEQDSRILIAQEGTTIEGFHVDAIRPNEIELTDSQQKGKHLIPTPGDR